MQIGGAGLRADVHDGCSAAIDTARLRHLTPRKGALVLCHFVDSDSGPW